MDVPNNICSLLIRGTGFNEAEIQCIVTIYNQIGKQEMYDYSRKKKILPFAANAFVNCNIDKDYWQDVLVEYRNRNRSILSFLDKVYIALHQEKVQKMFVSENFGALLASGSDIALFASGDIDNYADPAEKDKIYKAFDKIGCRRKERFSGKHQIAAEFFPSENENLPKGFYISVDFYPLARLKLPCFVNADDFVEWNKMTQYADTSINLPPADALTYICALHISLHSFSRAPDIRLYIDLLNTAKLQVDFEKIARWAKKDDTCTRLSVAVELANHLMKTKYPDSIINLSNRRGKVERLIYDKKNNDLLYEPKGLKVLQIEIMCNDHSAFQGIKEILFPDTQWMNKVYGGSGFIAHIQHLAKVI